MTLINEGPGDALHLILKKYKGAQSFEEFKKKKLLTHTHKTRLKKSNKMKQYADIYLLLNYCTCFGHPLCPSSGVHKTVFAALALSGHV